jgi:hypothetical protein
MSKITQRGAVAPLSPFTNISTGVPQQSFGANPGQGAQPSSGTGFYDPQANTYVGQKFDTSDGRTLVFVQNGAVAIGAGKQVQAPVEVTAFEKLAMTVPATYPATAGLFQFLVTNGATVLKANQFQQGYAVVASGTGLGQTLKISTHQPAAASATFVVTVEDPIQTTLDATSKISLIAGNFGGGFAGVVIANHVTLGVPVGVTLYGIAASTAATYDGTSGALTVNGTNQYGLLVTNGPTACLIDAVTNVGYPLGPSTNTDGALNVATLTSSPQIAISGQTQTTAQYGIVNLMLG